MGPIHSGHWLTPRAIGLWPESPKIAVQLQGPLDKIQRLLGRLVNPGGLRPKREIPGKAVRHHGLSDTVPIHPGQLVDPAGTRAQARVSPKIWSTPLAIGSERDSPGRAGQNCGPLDMGPSGPGHLVEPPGTRAWARVAWGSWSTLWATGLWPEAPRPQVDITGPRTRARVIRDCCLTPRTLRHKREMPRKAVRTLRHSPESPGTVVDPSDPQAWARVAPESWLTPRAIRTKRNSHGSAGQNCGQLDPSACHPGQLVDTAGSQTRACVARGR